MTHWFPGWGDAYYQHYTGLVLDFLIVAGIVLGILRCTKWRTAPGVQHAWASYRSWLLMIPVAFIALGLGRTPFILLLALLSVFCAKEFARATGLYEDWWFVGIIYAGIVGFYWAAWMPWYGLFVAMPVYGVAALLMIPVLRNEYAGMIQKVGLSTIALIYLGWFPAHLTFLGDFRYGYAYILFLLIATELNDVAAFTAGRLFGKRPLVSRISPKKTVEGVLGSLAATIAFVWAVRFWLPGFHLGLLALSVLIVWIGGTVGDLVISVVKRDIGIKDMGVLIPGHGGLLDRLDSLIFTAPLFFHMVNHCVRV